MKFHLFLSQRISLITKQISNKSFSGRMNVSSAEPRPKNKQTKQKKARKFFFLLPIHTHTTHDPETRKFFLQLLFQSAHTRTTFFFLVTVREVGVWNLESPTANVWKKGNSRKRMLAMTRELVCSISFPRLCLGFPSQYSKENTRAKKVYGSNGSDP